MLQVQAEDKQAAAEFMREKQQEAYAELLTDERALRRITDEYMPSLTAREPADKLAERKQAVDAAYLEVSQAANSVSLVGTPWASINAMEIDTNYLEIRGIIAATLIFSERQPLTDAEEQQFYDDYAARSSKIDQACVKFTQEARSTLGSDESR